MNTAPNKPETTDKLPEVATNGPGTIITQKDAPGGTVRKPINIKKIVGICIFSVGLLTLIGGVVFLVMTLLKEPEPRDAERLVEVGAWQREDEPGVIWNFTDIGKGTLTTNNHINDYDFIWSAEGRTLKIETAWLYDINDEYSFSLEGDKLILNNVAVFVPLEEAEPEEEETGDGGEEEPGESAEEEPSDANENSEEPTE